MLHELGFVPPTDMEARQAIGGISEVSGPDCPAFLSLKQEGPGLERVSEDAQTWVWAARPKPKVGRDASPLSTFVSEVLK